jgi:hypothetical protein
LLLLLLLLLLLRWLLLCWPLLLHQLPLQLNRSLQQHRHRGHYLATETDNTAAAAGCYCWAGWCLNRNVKHFRLLLRLLLLLLLLLPPTWPCKILLLASAMVQRS